MRLTLLAGLVAASALFAGTAAVHDPWGTCAGRTQPDPTKVCYAPANQAVDSMAIGLAASGHACVPINSWPTGSIPAGDVVDESGSYSYVPFTVAWALTHALKATAIEACSR